MLPVFETENPVIASVLIVALVIVGDVIVGLVSVLLVSVCESLVPTIVPVGAVLLQELVPVPVDTNKFVPEGVLLPVPSLVSTAINASFWLSWPPESEGAFVKLVLIGYGNDVPLSRE